MLRRRWLLPALLVLLLAVAWGLLQWWRGPRLAAYRVQSGPLVQEVVATGRITVPSRVQVSAEIAGLVLERRVLEGDRVAPGQVLVVLRARDLEARRDQARAALAALRTVERPQAQAQLREASARLDQAERELARRRALAERQLVARESVEQAAQALVAARAAAEQARLALAGVAGGPRQAQLQQQLAAAEAELERAVIRAPVAGTVLTRKVEPGDGVRPGQVLLEIAADAPGELLLPVDEKLVGRLRVGQPAIGIAEAYPDRPFSAQVYRIAPVVDPARGSVDVRLRLGADADFLRQDMTATATIRTGARTQALVVPNDALLDGSDGSQQAQVLVVRDGRVRRVAVLLGLRGTTASEVRSGLRRDDIVLAAAQLGATLPADGARVRTTLQPPPGADAATRRELPVKFD